MSPTLIFKSAYILGLVIQMIIRAPYRLATAKNKIAHKRADDTEMIALAFLFIGNFVIPLIYIFSPWLDFANYTLPDWAGGTGVILIACSLILFWRGHVDLGINWSPTLALREEHSLVTRGIYGYIRHPMYASQWLWVLAQPLLLQNWIAGPIGILAFAVLYFTRVAREEVMMIDHFGDEYRAYMGRTGRVLPHFTRSG